MKLLSSFKKWIINHDENKAFVLIYIGLAVTLSIVFGLFWLCAVVGVHIILELLRQYFKGLPPLKGFSTAIWETKLDIFLVVFAFVISVYMDVILGAAGLSAGARAAAGAGARFAGWQRVIRGIIISVDDLGLVFKSMSGKIFKGKKDSPETAASLNTGNPAVESSVQTQAEYKSEPADSPVTKGDIASLSFGGICIFLLIAAPFLTDYSAIQVIQIIVRELHPFH